MTPESKKVTGREAIAIVLADGMPMKSRDICAAAAKLVTMKGKTPEASLSALLAVQAKKPEGLVIRTAPGTFKLRPVPKVTETQSTEPAG